ncbi:unnamed protein product [Hydatigera taeniaeformis]|uniref:UDP-galactose translocator n=1 Tax=Hydatigena taeniaeformis TaxID=6205 RepID=A0A0R3WJV4_HYDTA|nr:unnamed protein product [Hydatigera taeniaeformis]
MPGCKCAKIGYLVVLSFQNVFHTLAMRYSRAEYRIRYSTSSVVILSEIVKFLISSLVLFHDGLIKRTISGIYYDTHDFLGTCVPALIYVIQNNVILFALSCLDATVFQRIQVTYQLKLLTTTMFSVLFLHRNISFVQWMSQIVLFIGVAVVQLQDYTAQSSAPTSLDASGAAGLMAVLSASILSGFAAVYFEKILKHSPKSLWTRNFELSLASIAIALVAQAISEGGRVKENGFFYGFDWLVWTTVGLQSIGGILVALVVKHADNILKGFACSASIIITCVISFVFLNSSLSWTFLFGTACVILAVFLYSLFPVPLGKSRRMLGLSLSLRFHSAELRTNLMQLKSSIRPIIYLSDKRRVMQLKVCRLLIGHGGPLILADNDKLIRLWAKLGIVASTIIFGAQLPQPRSVLGEEMVCSGFLVLNVKWRRN